MPRNTGGRKARMGSDSMLNYKGLPDYDAGNVNVQKNLNVVGHSVLNNVNAKNVTVDNVTVDNLTVTNATLSTFEVPVITSIPSDLPTSAGLITVDSTEDNGLMYFSIKDSTYQLKLNASAQYDGGKKANSAIAAITAQDVTDAGSLSAAIDAAGVGGATAGQEATGAAAVVTAAKNSPTDLADAKLKARTKAGLAANGEDADPVPASSLLLAKNTAVTNAAGRGEFQWIASNA